MSFELLRQYAEQRMVTNWAESAPVAYENMPFEAPSGVSWVRFTLINGEGQTRGMGGTDGSVRDTGMVSLQVFSPEGGGTKTSRELIDAFIAIFEHARFDGITTYTASATPAGVSNGWHQTNVTIPFRRTRNV